MSHFEASRCIFCGSIKGRILYDAEKYADGRKGKVIKCRNCGFIYRIPRQQYQYQRDLTPSNTYRLDSPDVLTPGRIMMFEEYITKINNFRKYNRILDVGTGNGYFLDCCKRDNWQVWGVEPEPTLAASARGRVGDHIFQETLEEARLPDNYFDVVTFWNVLEHIVEPDRALREALRVLRPGGVVFIRFPNAKIHVTCRWLIAKIYNVWRTIRVFDKFVVHLNSFDHRTIKQYLHNIGFVKIIVQNASLRRTNQEHKHFEMYNLFRFLLKLIAELVDQISHGHCLLSSSLSVQGVKPNNGLDSFNQQI